MTLRAAPYLLGQQMPQMRPAQVYALPEALTMKRPVPAAGVSMAVAAPHCRSLWSCISSQVSCALSSDEALDSISLIFSLCPFLVSLFQHASIPLLGVRASVVGVPLGGRLSSGWPSWCLPVP